MTGHEVGAGRVQGAVQRVMVAMLLSCLNSSPSAFLKAFRQLIEGMRWLMAVAGDGCAGGCVAVYNTLPPEEGELAYRPEEPAPGDVG